MSLACPNERCCCTREYDGAPMHIRQTYEAAFFKDIGNPAEQQDRVKVVWPVLELHGIANRLVPQCA